jgi:hypothetical protein
MFSLLVSDNLDKKSNKWGRLCAACAKLYTVKNLHRQRQTLKRDGKIIYTWVWREKNVKKHEKPWNNMKNMKTREICFRQSINVYAVKNREKTVKCT